MSLLPHVVQDPYGSAIALSTQYRSLNRPPAIDTVTIGVSRCQHILSTKTGGGRRIFKGGVQIPLAGKIWSVITPYWEYKIPNFAPIWGIYAYREGNLIAIESVVAGRIASQYTMFDT